MDFRPLLYVVLLLGCGESEGTSARDVDTAGLVVDGSSTDAIAPDLGPEPDAGDAGSNDAELPDGPPPAPAECGDGQREPGEFCPIEPYYWPTPEGSPVKVVLADLDEDGRPEIITAVLWAERVQVQRGTARREHPITQSVALEIEGVADVVAGDVDGDGDLDVVAAGLLGRSLQLLENDGGTLIAGQTLEVEGQPFTLDGGDFDKDGTFDVLVANFSRGGFTVAFGDRDEPLTRLAHFETGIEPHGAVAADVDLDGHLDAVVANAGTHNAGPDLVTVSFGRGDGTFDAPVEVQVGNGPFHVAVGDLNGDGLPDLVSADFGTPVSGADYAGGDTVSVALGAGGRTFGTAHAFPCGDGPNQVRLADLDGDGDLDAMTADRGNFDFGQRRAVGGGTLTVLMGDGAGTFGPPKAIELGASATGVAVGDLDGDGAPELIGVAHDGRRTVVVFQRP